jgi:hypothetical protein
MYVFGPEGDDWRKGCRCFECSQAAVLYEKRRVAARRRGEVAYVDATEARQHLTFLSANNVGRRTVSERTGLAQSTLAKILTGKVRRVRHSTADAILGVHLGMARPNASAPATRTLDQVTDLLMSGWTKAAIAGAIGKKTPALQIAKNGKVSARNARLVDELWRTEMAPVHASREWMRVERARYRALEREKSAS